MDTFTFSFVAAHTYTFATRINMNLTRPTTLTGGRDCTSPTKALLLYPFKVVLDDPDNAILLTLFLMCPFKMSVLNALMF